MARLPRPGGDNGNWGTILNDYLLQSLDNDGFIRDNAVTNSAIAPDAVTAAEIADDTIQEAQLASAIRTKLNQATPTWASLSGKPTVIGAGATALAARNEIDAIGRGDLVRTPYDHGAAGNGTANDTAAMQAAYDWLVARGGGTLLLPRGTFNISGNLEMVTPGVSLVGNGGSITGGEVIVGPATYTAGSSGIDFSGTCVRGVTFNRGDDYGTTRQLVLRNVRGLDIENNRFVSAGKGIAIEQADGNTKFHTTAMLNIAKNRFSKLTFGIYADSDEWDRFSDWQITDNFFNYCSDTSVWIANSTTAGIGGVDGLTFTGNTMFSLNFNSSSNPLFASKRHNVRLGQTDWLAISGNKFFEAGLSALVLENARHLDITGNHFAWPGQRSQSDCIEILAGSPGGVIQSNTFDWWTRAAVGMYGTTSVNSLKIGENAHRWSTTPDSWKGSDTITTNNSFRYFADSTVVGIPKIRFWDAPGCFDMIRGANRSGGRDQKSDYGGVSGSTRRSTTITAATPAALFQLGDITGSTVYNGLIIIQARSSSAGTSNATYVLAVESGGKTVATISAIGKTTGSVATDPSFTWTISASNILTATPAGATAGSFFIDVNCIGAVTAA